MPSPEEDYYQRLRVSRNASRTEIKAAFRRLARQYHPDLNPKNPQAQETFRALREAYEVLIDNVQRQRYDQVRPTGNRQKRFHRRRRNFICGVFIGRCRDSIERR